MCSQLQHILHSNLFMCSQRLSAYLRLVVELTLDAERSSLKEQVLGSELYGKGPEFDGSADPIVRVDARRLRDKLREYYSEFPPPTSGPRLTFSASGSFSGFVTHSLPLPLVLNFSAQHLPISHGVIVAESRAQLGPFSRLGSNGSHR